MEKYILYEEQYKSLIAIRDFAENAFCCYGENRGRTEELELADTFSLLVRDYINLIEATAETLSEYEAEQAEHARAFQRLYPKN